jgi:hypothetical protein
MKLILKFLSFIIFILVVAGSCKKEETKKDNELKEKWVSLFNGKDLQDWTIKINGHPAGDNYKNTFRVTDGVLQVNYDEYDKFGTSFGHIFYNKKFSNYRLRLEYRFTGEQLSDGPGWATRNSGVMLHCQSPESMGLNQTFPISVEAQLLGGLGTGPRSTGNVCTPGTNIMMAGELITTHCIESSSKTYDGDQWVKAELEVMNDSIIRHIINGESVMVYYKPQIGNGGVDGVDHSKWNVPDGTPLKNGFVSLQSESHPVEFRNIEILELNK